MLKHLSLLLFVGACFVLTQTACYNDKAENILGPNACDTINVSFSQHISPYVNAQCAGCHGGNSPSAGISLTNYTEIKASVTNGTFGGSINHLSGYSPMPKGAAKTEACMLSKINRWITQGAANN